MSLAGSLSAQQQENTAPTPSTLLQPSLSNLQQALGAVRLEKWKIPNALRGETDADINSINKDLTGTLPSLLAAADASPSSIAKTLPVLRNIDALYDVALRITTTGRLSAPSEQSAALQNALATLQNAKRDLGDRLQSSTGIQEQQVVDMQAALRTRPAVCPVVPPVAPPPASPQKTKKQKARSKAAPKPAPAQ
jgi:hypothetical protein